jgi:hypothetical protein
MLASENSPICASICAIRSGVISLASDNLELTLLDVSFQLAGRKTDRMVDEGDRVKEELCPTEAGAIGGTATSGRIATLSRPCFS